jgi:hypothetical protein
MSWFTWLSGIDSVQKQLDRMELSLILVLMKEREIMATLDEVLAKVTEESGTIDSLLALVVGLKEQLAEALSGMVLPPVVQEKVDAVFAGVQTNIDKVVAAINA